MIGVAVVKPPSDSRWDTATYRHDLCGGSGIQGQAWGDLNRGTLVDFDEGSRHYYCEDCREGFDGSICSVTPDGDCLMHDQPFQHCQQQAREEA